MKKIVNGNLFSDRFASKISEKNSEQNLPWKRIVRQIEGKRRPKHHPASPGLKQRKKIVKFAN